MRTSSSHRFGFNAQRRGTAPSIPAAFSPEVKPKYSAIHLCCSFSKDFMFYMGGKVSPGPILVPDGNESIHTSGFLFTLTGSSSRGKQAKPQLQALGVKTKRNKQILAGCTFLSCTLKGLLTINRSNSGPTHKGRWVLKTLSTARYGFLLSDGRKQCFL